MERRTEASFIDSIKKISIKETEFILEQMKTCVCKMHLGAKKGTGFFIKIPYRNQLLNVLMTNNHVLSENEISDGKNVTISINNGEVTKNIKMDSKRKRYTNEILDITIIELLEKDNIKHFLTLDKQILEKISLINDDNSIGYFNNLFENESLYVINNISDNNADEVFVSYGLLKEMVGN